MKKSTNGALQVHSPENIAGEMQGKSPAELCELIVSLLYLEPLFSAAQIAKREGMNVRDVRRAMRSGAMPHPILGPGYFCRGVNSKKVGASAVNAWRRQFFVSVSPRPEV